MYQTEAAEKLGVSPGLLSLWEASLELEVPTDGGDRRVYPPEVMAVLERVKDLWDDKAGLVTIQRRLAEAPQQEPAPLPALPMEGLVSLVRQKEDENRQLRQELMAVALMAARWQERAKGLEERLLEKPMPWWKRLFQQA